MMSALLSRCLILVLGTLYPAYRSYKAIKNKDLREHVKWMMYWIVFALFTTLETFLDIFVSWFPFYYEIKILFILWVLSPATRGSSLLYKKVVHPMLISREKEIDELIEKTKQQGYTTFVQLFSTGFTYASNFFVSSAVKGQLLLGSQLKKSLSLDDVNDSNKIVKPSKSNDGYFLKQAGTINEDEESSDFEQETRIKQVNLPKERKRSNNLSGNNSNNLYNINKGSYDLIDDDILLDDEMEAHKKVVTNKVVSRRRNKQSNEAATLANSAYKSNEMIEQGIAFRNDYKRKNIKK